jgi:hypothetical protein
MIILVIRVIGVIRLIRVARVIRLFGVNVATMVFTINQVIRDVAVVVLGCFVSLCH